MAVRHPLRNVPVRITVDDVVVTGVITSLYPNDMTVEIRSPCRGFSTGLHIPYFLMYRQNWLATYEGEATTTMTECGRARAEGLLRDLYDHARGVPINWGIAERRRGRWMRVQGWRRTHGDGTLPLYFSDDYCAVASQAETFQKARWIVESLAGQPIPGCELAEPDVVLDFAATVHRSDYICAIQRGTPRKLAESNGFGWERGVWTAARASNAGVVAAALEALASRTNTGSLSAGIHHARAGSGAAFCTFNGLAMAAREASGDGARVLILDVDAHCGGGTYSIVQGWKDVDHVDIATSTFDHYTPEPGGRSTLDIVEHPADYLPTIRRRLKAIRPDQYDLVLYGAGVDSFDADGAHPIDTKVLAEREAAVFRWANGRVPVAFCLLGGYVIPGLDRAGLVGLHRLTLAAAALANAGTRVTRRHVMDVASTQGETEMS